jgi:hypothetical protein
VVNNVAICTVALAPGIVPFLFVHKKNNNIPSQTKPTFHRQIDIEGGCFVDGRQLELVRHAVVGEGAPISRNRQTARTPNANLFFAQD